MREKIIGTIESMFMRYGIRSVTMDDIARELGISKKTLYQFVENKEDLIRQVTDEHLRRKRKQLEIIRSASLDPVHEMVNTVMHMIVEIQGISPATLYDLQKYHRENWNDFQCFHYGFVLEAVMSNIRRGIEAGLYRPNIDIDIFARFYISMPVILIDENLFPSNTFDKPRLLREFLVYHIHGIATPKGLALLQVYLNQQQTTISNQDPV